MKFNHKRTKCSGVAALHHSFLQGPMNLFGNSAPAEPIPLIPAQREPVSQALKDAADQSGVSFDYLLRTAKRESSLNPSAQARTSSASGLFQFVEQTWLGLVKNEGHRVGLTNASAYITEVSPGRYSVSDPEARQVILDMRKDPDLSSKMAAIFTSQNKQQLSRSIGREPNSGELYIAHFLGAAGGGGLIRLATQAPDAAAAEYFPEAAAANRSIFYDGARARTAAEVYANLVGRHSGAAPSNLPALQAFASPDGSVDMNSNGAWSGFRSKKPSQSGTFDLFRSDGAPVSDTIEKVWTKRKIDDEQGGAFALRPALSADAATTGAVGSANAVPAGQREAASAKPAPMPLEEDDEPRRKKPKPTAEAVGQPIDLLKFRRLKG
jgi:hypothetical protein